MMPKHAKLFEMLKSNSDKLIVVLILLLALLLRLPLLSGSFWLDEAAQALESARPLSQQFQIATDFQPPLLHLITWLALQFGQSESWLRTIGALIPGILTIGLTYAIGRKIANKQTAIISSLLLTTSSFHIFYSQELRPYALAALWATLSWWCLIKLLPSETQNYKLSKGWLIAFIISTVFGLYTMYLYPFVFLAQLVWSVIFLAKNKKVVLAAGLVAAATFLPWLPKFFEQLSVSHALTLAVPDWQTVVGTPILKALPLTLGKFVFGVLDLQITWTYLLPASLILLLLGVSLGEVLRHVRVLSLTHRKNFWLLLLWTFVPILVGWIISFVIPVLQPKRVLLALPAFYLLLTYVWFYLPQLNQTKHAGVQKVAGGLGLILILVINLFSSYQYWVNPRLQRENWRDLVSYLEKNYSQETTTMVYGFDGAFAPIVWYQTKPFETFATSTSTLNPTLDIEPLANYFAKSTTTILVFDYLLDLTDPARTINQALIQSNYSVTKLIPAGNIGFVREYTHE